MTKIQLEQVIIALRAKCNALYAENAALCAHSALRAKPVASATPRGDLGRARISARGAAVQELVKMFPKRYNGFTGAEVDHQVSLMR